MIKKIICFFKGHLWTSWHRENEKYYDSYIWRECIRCKCTQIEDI